MLIFRTVPSPASRALLGTYHIHHILAFSMSLFKGIKTSSTQSYDLDGSDGPAQHPKSQAQYAEEVKAYLETARAALRQLTVASVEDLCLDPALDPVYVGCMRELAGLGYGHGGKEGLAFKSEPTQGLENQQIAIPASLKKSVIKQRLLPGYTFTAYFFPRETYSQCARADRPSEASLTRAMTAAMKENPSTAHITEPTTVSWTPNGDIVVDIPPDAIAIEPFIRQISVLKVLKKASPSSSNIHFPSWCRIRVYGDPPILVLRLHRVPQTWLPDNDMAQVRTLFPVVATGSEESTLVEYALPQGFLITGRAKILEGEKGDGGEAIYDVFIDLSGLEHPFVANVRRASRNSAKLKGVHRQTLYTFSTSFLELND